MIVDSMTHREAYAELDKDRDNVARWFDHRLAGRSVRYNGRDHKFLAIDCGVLLGDIEDNIFIARTFITYEMATGKQHEAFSYAKNRLLNTEDMIKYIRDNSLYNQNKLIEFSNNL